MSDTIRAQAALFWVRAAYVRKNVELRVIVELEGSLEASWVSQLLC